jgi:lipopolysaccharide exporter
MSKATLSHRAAFGAIWSAIEMVVTQIVSLATFAVMSRFIAPSEFGLISISYVVIYSFKILIIDPIGYAVIRKKEPTETEYSTAFWLTLAIATAGSLIAYAVAGTLEVLINAPGLSHVVRALSILPLFMGLGRTQEVRLIRTFQFRTLALRGISGTLLGGAVGIALAYQNYGVSALVYQQIVMSLTSLALLWLYSRWRPEIVMSVDIIRDILVFMRSTVPTNLVSFMGQHCDTLLIAWFFGPTDVGIYSLAKRLRLALQLVVAAPINGVILPSLAEVQDSSARLQQASRKMLAAISLVCFPTFLGLSSVAEGAIQLIFGAQWIPAAPILAILCVGGLAATLQGFCEALIVLKNRQVLLLYNVIVQVLLSIVLFFFVTKLDRQYLSIPFVAPYAVTLSIATIVASRLASLKIYDWLAALGPSLISAIIMFGAIKAIGFYTGSSFGFSRFAGMVLVGATLYLACMLIIDRKIVLFTFGILVRFLARHQS